MRISDWSSDVCSSDLHLKRLGIDLPDQVEIDEAVVDRRHQRVGAGREVAREDVVAARRIGDQIVGAFGEARDLFVEFLDRRRSEARRVGKECVRTCRSRCWPDHYKNKTDRPNAKSGTRTLAVRGLRSKN